LPEALKCTANVPCIGIIGIVKSPLAFRGGVA